MKQRYILLSIWFYTSIDFIYTFVERLSNYPTGVVPLREKSSPAANNSEAGFKKYQMFDKAICINLDHRTDRWATCEKEFAKWGIEVERFSAMNGNNGMQGLHLSNQAIFKANAGKSLLVLEDDVVFHRPFYGLEECFADLPANWDMLYLGGNATQPQKRYSNWLYKADGILTTHAILYSAKMTAWLADNMEVPEVVTRQNTIDVWYAEEIQPKFNCFIAYPQIAGQRFGYSDICEMDINYSFFNNQAKRFY